MTERLDRRLEQLASEQAGAAPPPAEWDSIVARAHRQGPTEPSRRMPLVAAAMALIVGGVVVIALVTGRDGSSPVAEAPATSGTVDGDAVAPTSVPPMPTTSPGGIDPLVEIEHSVLIDGEPAGDTWVTGLAATQDELVALWSDVGVPKPLPGIDFATDVLIYFGPAESGSCRYAPLQAIAHDPTTGRVFPVLDLDPPVAEGEERECTADANPHAIIVVVARDSLPASDFVIWVDNNDPPACCGSNVTRVAAGELATQEPSTGRDANADPAAVELLVVDPPPDGFNLFRATADSAGIGIARYRHPDHGTELQVILRGFPLPVGTLASLDRTTWEVDGRTFWADGEVNECLPDYCTIGTQWNEATYVSIAWADPRGGTLAEGSTVESLLDLALRLTPQPEAWSAGSLSGPASDDGTTGVAEGLVLVANANTTGGSAGALSALLDRAGYDVVEPANSTLPGSDVSIIYAQPDAECLAAQLADILRVQAIEPMPDELPVDDPGAYGQPDVLIELGDDVAMALGDDPELPEPLLGCG